MRMANEPITWIEAAELWRDMRLTNNTELPTLEETLKSLISAQLQTRVRNDEEDLTFVSMKSTCLNDDVEEQSIEESECTKKSSNEELQGYDQVKTFNGIDGHSSSLLQQEEPNNIPLCSREVTKKPGIPVLPTILLKEQEEEDVNDLNAASCDLSPEEIVQVAKGVKRVYGIRESNDKSELKFVCGALFLLWFVTLTLVFIRQVFPSSATILGTFTWKVLIEAVILFVGELLWECVLSALVLKYNIKINYTRKLGNLFKVPKYFAADLFPFYESTPTSLVTSLAINQSLFCLVYYRNSREQCPFFSYVFLSQDRREDRPDTLIFQVTEDILRFSIYFPFKLLVANRIGAPSLIFIPVAVNNIGDGLAEPVGVAFGRHKYSTTALYHKGKFFKSKFTRSYEGSACVFITTIIVVAIYYNVFSKTQFWITILLLPPLMTVAEAKAPHTNDGPFLALVGCSFLSAIFLL